VNIKQAIFAGTVIVLGILLMNYVLALKEGMEFIEFLPYTLAGLGISGILILVLIGVFIIYDKLGDGRWRV